MFDSLVEALQASPSGQNSLVVRERVEGVLAVVCPEPTAPNTSKRKSRHWSSQTIIDV